MYQGALLHKSPAKRCTQDGLFGTARSVAVWVWWVWGANFFGEVLRGVEIIHAK